MKIVCAWMYAIGRYGFPPSIGDVLKAIRSDERFDDLPVVMMTGIEDDAEKEEAARNGANSYTVKPDDPGEFLKTVVKATRYWVAIHDRPHVACGG